MKFHCVTQREREREPEVFLRSHIWSLSMLTYWSFILCVSVCVQIVQTEENARDTQTEMLFLPFNETTTAIVSMIKLQKSPLCFSCLHWVQHWEYPNCAVTSISENIKYGIHQQNGLKGCLKKWPENKILKHKIRTFHWAKWDSLLKTPFFRKCFSLTSSTKTNGTLTLFHKYRSYIWCWCIFIFISSNLSQFKSTCSSRSGDHRIA